MTNKNIVSFYAVSDAEGKLCGRIGFPGKEKNPKKQLALIAKALSALCLSGGEFDIAKAKTDRITPFIEFYVYVDFVDDPKPQITGEPTPEETGALILTSLDSWLAKNPKFSLCDILSASTAATIAGVKEVKPGTHPAMLASVALSALLQSKIPTSAPGFAAEMIITTCDRLPRRTRFVVGLRAIASAIFGSFSH